QKLVVVVCGVIGSADVELVDAVFAAAVTDKEKEERIARLELLLQRRERFLDFGLGSLRASQQDHVVRRKTKFIDQGLGSAGSPLLELFFVFGTARYTAKDQRARVGKRQSRYQQTQNKG